MYELSLINSIFNINICKISLILNKNCDKVEVYKSGYIVTLKSLIMMIIPLKNYIKIISLRGQEFININKLELYLLNINKIEDC